MKARIIILLVALILTSSVAESQSPFPGGRNSLLLSNSLSGASEKWVSLYTPTSLSSNYRLILPNSVPTSGQFLNIASISGSDFTTQWRNVSDLAWSLSGNSGTSSGTNFLGTTDAQDLMMKVNNTERFTLKQASGFLHLNQVNQNTMMGYQVANSLATGGGGANTGFGYQSLYNLTTGSSNVALGFVAMSTNTTGSHNTALGTVALNFNTGSYNVGVGSWSGYWMTGNHNVVLGYQSGFLHTSGNYNIFIGDSTFHPSTSSGSNLLSIGNTIYGTGINTSSPAIGIGTSSTVSGATLDVRGSLALTNADNTAKELRLYEPSSSGSQYSSFKSPVLAATVNYTLPTSDGSSGTVLTTNGSGTLSWSTPPGSVTVKYKATDESYATGTSVQDDDDLFFSIAANEIWEVEWYLHVTGQAASFKIGLTLPTGATMKTGVHQENSNGVNDYELLTTSGTPTSSNFDIVDAGTAFVVRSFIINSSTAGTVHLQWGRFNAGGTATVRSHSYMKAIKVQ